MLPPVRWVRFGLLVLLALPAFFTLNISANAQTAWPDSISLSLIESSFSLPVHINHAGDGSGRLFVVEQAGRVYILKNGDRLNTPFLDIRQRVLAPGDAGAGSEEGLLSIAFPPGFGESANHFYVYYTNLNSNNQVSRFSVSADADIADPNSEKLILEIPHPGQVNHNGGQLAFGPDGYLYIGTGDGGGGDDPDENAQDKMELLGKLLRINVEGSPAAPNPTDHQVFLPLTFGSGATAYTIPDDNPFVGVPCYRPEIWALGLRNPWRFSFDRLTGDVYIGDVGQDRWEEIDFQEAGIGGQNYGWDIMEGLVCNEPMTGCPQTGLTLPVHVYTQGSFQAVTGGFVYRGQTYPALQGIYIYADYATGEIWGLQRDELGDWQNQLQLSTNHSLSSFGEDESGELYLASLYTGNIYQVVTP